MVNFNDEDISQKSDGSMKILLKSDSTSIFSSVSVIDSGTNVQCWDFMG